MLTTAFPISVEMRYKNIIQVKGNGDRLLYPKWNQPLLSFSYSRSKITDVEIEVLRELWEELKGREGVVLFTDYSDNRASANELINSFGTSTQGVALSQDGLEFQLFKCYSLEGVDVYRPITRPVESPLFTITSSDSYTVDWDKGVVTFDVVQPLSLNWGGTFRVPCRLELNPTETKEDEDKYFSISRLEINEVREQPLFYAPYTWAEEIDHEYQLYSEIGAQTVREYQPLISQFDSGWETRREQQENPLLRYVTGKREKNFQRHVDYIIALWRVTRGGAIPFIYQGKQVQGRGSLNLTIQNENIFSISPLEFAQPEVEKVPPSYEVPPFSIAAEPIFVDLAAGEQGEEAIVTESNPSGSATASGGGGGGATGGAASSTAGIENASYTLSSFSVDNVSFSNSPIAVNYSNFRQLFWAGGTLNLCISDPANPYIWYLYRLDLSNNNWDFIYQASSLPDYKFASLVFVYPSPVGVALVGRTYYPLPAPNNSATNGILIFTVKNDGSTAADFIPDTLSSVGNLGQPYRVAGDRLFLHNAAYPIANGEIADNLGTIAGFEVYAGYLQGNSEIYPLRANKTISGVQAPGSGVMEGQTANQTGEGKARILVDGEPYYEYFPDSANRLPILFKETWGSDGSHVVFSKTENLCTNQVLGCSSEFWQSYYQIWHKQTWDSNYELIEDFEASPSSSDATRKFQSNFTDQAYRYKCDKHGNICQYITNTSLGQPILYYHRQAGHALDLKLALNLPSNFIVLMIADSPYGFVIMARNSFNNALYIYIVQSS